MVLATKRAVGSEYGYPMQHTIPAVQQTTPAPQQKVRARTRKRPAPAVGIAVIALLFMIGISYTFLQAAKAHLLWQANQVKAANEAIQMDNEKLKLEVARMKSLDRIEAIAVQQLKMVQNPSVVYLTYQNQQEQGVEMPGSFVAQANEDTAATGSTVRKNLMEIIAAVISKGVIARG